jgi:NAD(P)-dependent dehydrogenase (short-subunit alcohol dehydrogenase family)
MAPDLYALYTLTKETHHDVYPSISPSNPSLSVSGQVVLITGGGTGIGLATANFYAQAGAKDVIITGRTEASLKIAAAEIAKLSPKVRVHTFPVDISSKDSIKLLWNRVSGEVGHVDVLINNAGRGGPHEKIGEGKVDEWWAVQVRRTPFILLGWRLLMWRQQTNVFGTYVMCDEFAASLMKENSSTPRQGTVINVSSGMGFLEMPGSSSYSVSKLAMAKITQYLHAESPNIRAFVVHPGIIPTAISTLGESAKDTVELAAGLNLYLASHRADFLRGRYTTANWDVDEMEAHKEEILRGNMLRADLTVAIGETHDYKWGSSA